MTKGIIHSGPMVRAYLDGSKTQTRRLISDQPSQMDEAYFSHFRKDFGGRKCPYGQVGDLFYVRETWADLYDLRSSDPGPTALIAKVFYKADYPEGLYHSDDGSALKWRPSIHMPRKFARIWREITGIRVERVQDISEADAKAEGVERLGGLWKCYENCAIHKRGYNKRTSASASFMSLWTTIYGPEAWERNEWVWVIESKEARG